MSVSAAAVRLIRFRRFEDDRGWFGETYNRCRFAALGLDLDFVQDNHSLSRQPGTVRGLHFQAPPYSQAKLVRCVRGRILDVAVDIRTGSPTYGRWVAAELSAHEGDQLFVPIGFAHGFMTLEPDTEVTYKVSAPYHRTSEGGVMWNDADLNIAWPIEASKAILSSKDVALPALAQITSPFVFEGTPLGPILTFS